MKRYLSLIASSAVLAASLSYSGEAVANHQIAGTTWTIFDQHNQCGIGQAYWNSDFRYVIFVTGSKDTGKWYFHVNRTPGFDGVHDLRFIFSDGTDRSITATNISLVPPSEKFVVSYLTSDSFILYDNNYLVGNFPITDNLQAVNAMEQCANMGM